MNVADEAGPVLVVRRQIAVPRERVFAAWLDSESLAEWMRPGDFDRSTVTMDPRVGGGFSIVMQKGPAHDPIEHRGEYLAIEPPSLLSFTWISKNTDHQRTVVTVEFHERGGGTELVLTHRGLLEKAVEGHRWGWTECLRSLDQTLARG